MKDLENAGVGQQRLEARRLKGLTVDLDKMGIAIAGRELDEQSLSRWG